ncbi:hypothetical protein Vretifemale_12364, partial [Volvox reticuliferus]
MSSRATRAISLLPPPPAYVDRDVGGHRQLRHHRHHHHDVTTLPLPYLSAAPTKPNNLHAQSLTCSTAPRGGGGASICRRRRLMRYRAVLVLAVASVFGVESVWTWFDW